MMMEIQIERATSFKPKPDASQLGFGQIFTDHMFLLDYTEGRGWHDARIVPYAPFSLDPAAMVFHYGQAVFEGLKAYRSEDGSVLLFRPEKNARRFNVSNERLNIPQLDEALFVEAVQALVREEADWIPNTQGASLYLRPFVIATEPALGVRASNRYLFAVIASPVGAYYAGGMKPVSIQVESSYVRAVRGGLGFAKTPANYASSLRAQTLAKSTGAEQVLWLDAVEHKYIEEAGSMNVFFAVDDAVWTPSLSGSILDGVTRDSVLSLLKHWGIPVVEGSLSIDEVTQAAGDGRLKEAFGTGTAAVIAPIGSLHWEGQKHLLSGGHIGELSQKLYDTMTGIQTGKLEDPFGWVRKVER